MNVFEICKHFGITPVASKVISKGLINTSWEVADNNKNSYVVQGINTYVFKDVDGLMDNIARVTEHIRHKVEQEGGDVEREVLSLIPSDDTGLNYWVSPKDEGVYRVYKCITNASTYDEANTQLLFQAGVGFGKFQRQLSDFDAASLKESIPDFHNTIARYAAFREQLQSINFSTYKKAREEITQAIRLKEYASKIMEPLLSGKIPTRVVHNDTKLNNVMLDDSTHKSVCVIDLDTIMPGSILFDYGDAIRYCANTGAEDELNMDNIKLDPKKFMSFTHGFLSETASTITKEELDLMSNAPIVLTYELGLRFLTDYLNGNKYFKCDPARPDHNLERARAQFKLCNEFVKHEPDMNRSIHDIYNTVIKQENKTTKNRQ